MTVDKDALYETLDRVIAVAPEGKWDQGDWLCGSVGCFCGHRALMDGARESRGVTHFPDGRGLLSNGGGWQEWGTLRFGLTDEQARALFWSHNTLEDLKEIVDQICSEPTP